MDISGRHIGEAIAELERECEEKEQWKRELEEEERVSEHYLLCLRQHIETQRETLRRIRISIKNKEKWEDHGTNEKE